jgi:DNA recombination protein RmuC
MEYVIIGLLVVVVILSTISLFRNKSDIVLIDKLSSLELSINKEMSDLKVSLNKDFNELSDKQERRLIAINDRVNERIDQNFERTNKTFNSLLERLAKIDEAQKKIDVLSSDIVSLQGILTDKKTRGIFGEVNLKHILSSVFGERNDSIYRLQYTMPNGFVADSILFAPEPLGTIAIDSKFPLENYRMMVDKNVSKDERARYEKLFKADVKKHIDAISSKYIINGYTSDQAIMFLPAEAIFAEINAYHSDVIDYAYKKRVWIASPTTLISTLTVIEMIIKNIERDKYTSVIHEELNKLGIEFNRYKERWDKLSRSIETVSRDVNDIHTTTDKITKRFNSISRVEIDCDEKIE